MTIPLRNHITAGVGLPDRQYREIKTCHVRVISGNKNNLHYDKQRKKGSIVTHNSYHQPVNRYHDLASIYVFFISL